MHSPWPKATVIDDRVHLAIGLDADHLAAIDGLTRLSSRQGRSYARYCGALFSLGHGMVVLSIAALAGALGSHWVPPSWFESLGSIISIGFLAVIVLIGASYLVAYRVAALRQPQAAGS